VSKSAGEYKFMIYRKHMRYLLQEVPSETL